MNSQLTATIRYILTALASYGAGKGWFTIEQAPDIVNALLTVITGAVGGGMMLWGIISQSKNNKIASVQASPTEQVITTDPAVKLANPGVVLASTTQQTVVAPVPKAS